LWIKKLIFMKKIIIILCIFFFDRITKIYLINLQAEGIDIDFYISSFLNFYLVWNTGIGFGLASMEANIYYHILTLIIIIVNFILIYLLFKSKGIYSYLIAVIIGGSLGNLFDRIYYFAVPDFIDLHLGNHHWFIFNVADIFITVGIIGIISVEYLKKDKISKDV
tara:strand:- start:3336 stop:3830 length:495 start_codon:yes stop_codon:yes gene_type:complete